MLGVYLLLSTLHMEPMSPAELSACVVAMLVSHLAQDSLTPLPNRDCSPTTIPTQLSYVF